jgi:hypothetical protein
MLAATHTAETKSELIQHLPQSERTAIQFGLLKGPLKGHKFSGNDGVNLHLPDLNILAQCDTRPAEPMVTPA